MVTQQPARRSQRTDPAGRGYDIAAVVIALVVIVVVVVALVSSFGGPAISGQSTATTSADPSEPRSPTSSTAPSEEAPTPTGESSASASATPTESAGSDATPVELPPIPIASPAVPITGLTVTITGLAAIQGVGSGIGETGGPAIQFTVNAANSTAEAVSLQTAVVTVSYGPNATPSDELLSSRVALPDTVAPGATAQGSFVFTIPSDQRQNVSISFDYRAGTPVSVFEGAAP